MLGPIVIGGAGGGAGQPGKSVEIGVSATHIQWRLVGDAAWTNIVALADLKGLPGTNGTNGVDGKSVELQKTGTHVQWRQVGGAWANLIALADITGPAGAAGGQLVFKGSVQLTANDAAYNIAAAAPAGSTHVVIEAVGGGASGMCLGGVTSPAPGGYPGAVERTAMLALNSLPATVAVTIGAGGAAYASSAGAYAATPGNAGGQTRVGDLILAAGGPNHGDLSVPMSRLLCSTSYFPSIPGFLDQANLTPGRAATAGAFGPGAGGGAASNTSNGTGGNGGAGGARIPGKSTAGGVGAAGAVGGNGANAVDHFGYGGGGAGSGVGANVGMGGGNGGFPGGGGGGVSRSNGTTVTAGAGGNGAVRLFFYGAA